MNKAACFCGVQRQMGVDSKMKSEFLREARHSGHAEDWSVAAGSHPQVQVEPGSLVGSESRPGA